MQQFDTLQPYCPPSSLTGNVMLVDTMGETWTMSGDSTVYCCAYDSIFPPIGLRPLPQVRKSLFTHSQLAVQHHQEINIHHAGTSGWYLGIIALSIFLICFFLRHKQIRLVTILQSAIDHRAMDRLLRDTNLTHAPDMTPIAFIMLIPLVLVGYYFFFTHGNNTWLEMAHYLMLLLAGTVIYFARNGIFRFIGNAFDNQEVVHLYLSSNYIYHFLYAVAAAALAFLILYTDSIGHIFFYILAGILAILFSARVIRGLQLILTFAKTSKFYLFCYLCILEIVPIVILIKVAISY